MLLILTPGHRYSVPIFIRLVLRMIMLTIVTKFALADAVELADGFVLVLGAGDHG